MLGFRKAAYSLAKCTCMLIRITLLLVGCPSLWSRAKSRVAAKANPSLLKCCQKQRVRTPQRIVRWNTLINNRFQLQFLQGFANSDKGDSNPGKHLSSPPALSPIPERRDPMGSPSRQEMTPSPSRMLSPSAQSPRLLQSSSPISVPTSPSSASLTPNSSALNFANPFMSGAMNAQRQFQHLSSPGLLPPGMNPFFPHAGMMLPGGMPNPFQRFPTDPRIQQNLFDPTKQFPRPGWPGGLGGPQKRSIIDDDEAGMTMDQKKLRLQSSMRMLKDEPVPEGYMRFR